MSNRSRDSEGVCIGHGKECLDVGGLKNPSLGWQIQGEPPTEVLDNFTGLFSSCESFNDVGDLAEVDPAHNWPRLKRSLNPARSGLGPFKPTQHGP